MCKCLVILCQIFNVSSFYKRIQLYGGEDNLPGNIQEVWVPQSRVLKAIDNYIIKHIIGLLLHK